MTPPPASPRARTRGLVGRGLSVRTDASAVTVAANRARPARLIPILLAGALSLAAPPGRPRTERRLELDGLPVGPGMEPLRGINPKRGRAPLPTRGAGAGARCVDDDDAETPAASVGRAPLANGPLSAYGIVRHEHDRRAGVAGAGSSTSSSSDASAPGRGRRARSRARCGPSRRDNPDRRTASPYTPSDTQLRKTRPLTSPRSIRPSIPSLRASSDAGRIGRVEPQVPGEVVPGPGGHAHERQVVRARGGGDRGQRAVAARNGQRVGPAGDGVVDERRQASIRSELRDGNAPSVGLLGNSHPRAGAGPRVYEQRRPTGRIGSLPRDSRHRR